MKTMNQVLDWHLERYPLLQAADIYKLVHQGVFGPGHIIENQEQVRQALAAEFAEIRKRCCLQTTEPVEPLDPDGDLVRVNLEPLRSVTDIETRLAEVLVRTAGMVSGETGVMEQRLSQAVNWCHNRLPDQAEPLAALAVQTRSQDFPPRHHSQVYETAYRPAYRVVSAELWRAVELPGPGSGSCPPRPPDTSA